MQIVFNLYPVTASLYLPSAWLVHEDARGGLSYLAQKATQATCAPYGIDWTPALQKLAQTIDTLSPKALEAHFKPAKSKSATPLTELLQPQHPAKTSVESYIYRHLSAFLNEVVRQGLPLTLHAEKKTLVKDVQILTQTEPLIPHLSFKKTDDGIEYRLELGTETEKWPVSRHEVIALTNTDPAWILVDYALFRVPGINGFMVNPFRAKELVRIPPDQVKVYFKRFIARNAGRNRIEAEGFAVQSAERLLRTRLVLTEDVIHQQWVVKPVFEYENISFDWGEKRNHVTTVEFEEAGDEVVVKKVVRDLDAEEKNISWLLQKGFQANGRVLVPEAGLSAYDSLDWWIRHLSEQRKALEKAGLVVQAPEIDGRVIALETGILALRSDTRGDWFDVEGLVTAGGFTFSFRDLAPYLRGQDRFYPLPDGTFFLIPEAWFTRYTDLARSLRDTPEGLRLPKALFTLLEGVAAAEETLDFPVIDPETVDYTPDADLKATLRPYQLYGVKWLIGHYQHGFGACLADSMGLGKTLQTIALLLHAKKQRPAAPEAPAPPPVPQREPSKGIQLDMFNPFHQEITAVETDYPPTPHLPAAAGAHPALLILPASLVFNWQREIEKFAPSLFTRVHTGPQRDKDARALGFHDVVLTTYHTARQDLEILQKVPWEFIILDESQQIKNRDSEISKMVRRIDAHHKISLSGTPIENSLADLWTQMEFINPSILGTYPSFKEIFQIPIERHNDPTAREQLFRRVRPFFLRRTKEEVTPDLPPLTEQVFFTEMSEPQRRRYESVKSAVRNEILQLFDDPKTRLLAIQALTKLRQIANHPVLEEKDYTGDSGKMDDVLAQWDTLYKDGHKVLFFSSFTQHLALYRQEFERRGLPYCWLTGSVPQSERGAIIERFQQDENVQAFFCSIKAGGTGLNLTAAGYVFLLDPWWNPAAEDQAVARAHRIGQNKPVNAVRFIARDSIEEKIRWMQERKKALGQALFATENETPEFTRADLEELLS